MTAGMAGVETEYINFLWGDLCGVVCMYGPTSLAGICNEGGEPGGRGRRAILCCTSNGRDGHDSPERLRALQGRGGGRASVYGTLQVGT